MPKNRRLIHRARKPQQLWQKRGKYAILNGSQYYTDVVKKIVVFPLLFSLPIYFMKLTPKTSVIGAVVAVFALGIIVLAQNQLMVKGDLNADMGGDSYMDPTTDSDSDSKPTTPETEGGTPTETPTATPPATPPATTPTKPSDTNRPTTTTPTEPTGPTPPTTPNQPAAVCTCSCLRKNNGLTSTLCQVPNTAGTPSRYPTCPGTNANYIVDNKTATECADLNKQDTDVCDGYSPVGTQNSTVRGDLTSCSMRVPTR
jgi:hypothetical protein